MRSQMQFMVIERFRNQDARAIYRRLRERGRMMPEGLTYVSSWVSADLGRCFQLMETDDVNPAVALDRRLVRFDGVRSRAGRARRQDGRGARWPIGLSGVGLRRGLFGPVSQYEGNAA